jgi:UDP-galactopyranose mutase
MAEPVFEKNITGQIAICFSHLRWDFVYQRPQHLMERLCAEMPVVFWEEPVLAPGATPELQLEPRSPRLTVARMRLPEGLSPEEAEAAQRQALDELLQTRGAPSPMLWYYTPMMLAFSDHLNPDLVVYDCMDELSAFKGAPPGLRALEERLMQRADLVFTGGHSLYEARRHRHRDIHPFPSSVDATHFRAARAPAPDPADQTSIPHPRAGYYGVIDERLDIPLLAGLADSHPDWHFVMVGPVVKIAPQDLPRRDNIHYLGSKPYRELPAYVAGWDVAMMPFAQNESTRFISPTKLPEYLAAGRPVVSTPIVDVVRQYAGLRGVTIADGLDAFAAGIRDSFALAGRPDWLVRIDEMLADMSWDRTWAAMSALMARKRLARHTAADTRPRQRMAPRTVHLARRPAYDYLVVGAGFAGAVLAERLARADGARVLVVDRRPHIGGNAYDHHDEAGLLVHQYGPHIFHTNAPRVVDYLSRFTRWRPYEHRVLARVGDNLLPVPINRTTVNRFFGLDLSATEVESFLASKAVPVDDIRTSEDIVLSKVGRELYDAMFRGYTRKQWGVFPDQLDKSVAGRIPVRSNDDDRYFNDTFQQMPLHGYTRMFENMLDHANITLMLGCEWRDVRDEVEYGHLVFTGPVDEYFGHRLGHLPYRSLRFRHETVDTERFQPVGVVNYPSPEVPYTRITEYKYLTGQQHPRTSITYEYPSAEGDPYYPVPRPENAALYTRYQAMADAQRDVTFVGRLATYRYYNMDQVVAQALTVHDRLRGRKPAHARSQAAAQLHAGE